jgi:hypothetical protein
MLPKRVTPCDCAMSREMAAHIGLAMLVPPRRDQGRLGRTGLAAIDEESWRIPVGSHRNIRNVASPVVGHVESALPVGLANTTLFPPPPESLTGQLSL